MESDIPLVCLSSIQLKLETIPVYVWVNIFVILILIISSALVSGAEVAFFSMGPKDINKLKNTKNASYKKTFSLIQAPQKLLATILVANNVINIAIVVLSTYLVDIMFDFGNNEWLGFFVEVISITFIILLFGEIIPKVYATRHSLAFSVFMTVPIIFTRKIFSPLIYILIRMDKAINKKIDLKAKNNVSFEDLSEAIELTHDVVEEDEKILKGIVEYSNTCVDEVMKPRVDVIAVEIKTPFSELIKTVVDSSFSRIPVYVGSFDSIHGVLYAKDLLPHIHKSSNFSWQSLIRPPYFVPESKKISDLLEEFQTKKIHMAFVFDEYGGTSGIITLEDILSEVMGEFKDESDVDEEFVQKINDKEFVFEGKTLINDVCRVIQEDTDTFDNFKGDADTLAGLVLEQKGEIPKLGEQFEIANYKLEIISVDDRRIKKIKLKMV